MSMPPQVGRQVVDFLWGNTLDAVNFGILKGGGALCLDKITGRRRRAICSRDNAFALRFCGFAAYQGGRSDLTRSEPAGGARTEIPLDLSHAPVHKQLDTRNET